MHAWQHVLIDLVNQGNLALHHNRLIEAEALYQQAIQIKRDIPEAYNNLGTVLKEQGKLDAAKKAFQKALALRPNYASAHSNLLFTLHYEQNQTLQGLRKAHEQWAKQQLSKKQSRKTNIPINPTQPIKIGILSPDLYYHPVGIFIYPWLAQRDKQSYELIVYHDTGRIDQFTQQIQQQVDQFKPVAGMSDAQLSALIQSDGITLLIELSGHTAGNRLPMLSARVAPIQVSWIGYPSTTGVANIDYVFMDHYVAPVGYESGFTEQVVRLSGLRFCYTPPSYAPLVTAMPSLQKGCITFGSFNNLAKLTPEVISAWSKILQSTPNSRLRLKWKSLNDEATRQFVKEQFQQQGIEPDRIECRGWSSHPEMLSEYGDVDIALDPFPFSGGLTSCDALYMGVPIVTLAGKLPISRQTASFLHAMGKNDWIANTIEDYVRIAVTLAEQVTSLTETRQGLRVEMMSSDLGDAKRFASSVDQAITSLLQEKNQ